MIDVLMYGLFGFYVGFVGRWLFDELKGNEHADSATTGLLRMLR